MEELIKSYDMFESIKHIDEEGCEYWMARELMNVLDYNKWENFEKVIDKAKVSCEKSGISVIDHFPDVRKTIKMPKGAEKIIIDYKLTRYSCYLTIVNKKSPIFSMK